VTATQIATGSNGVKGIGGCLDHTLKMKKEDIETDSEDDREVEFIIEEIVDDYTKARMSMLASMALDLMEPNDEGILEAVRTARGTRAPNKSRDFKAANNQVTKDYCNDIDSIYSERDFERRFRVP
jgi:hypothetical protein